MVPLGLKSHRAKNLGATQADKYLVAMKWRAHRCDNNLTRPSRRILNGVTSDFPVTWRDVAIWLDTGGSASIYRHHARYESVIHIAQKEREPLQRLCDFVKSQGIRCKVRTAGKTNGMYVLEVRPVLSQAAFLAAVRPLLMTRNKIKSAGSRRPLSKRAGKDRKTEEGIN